MKKRNRSFVCQGDYRYHTSKYADSQEKLWKPRVDMGLSQNRGPQYRPQDHIISILGNHNKRHPEFVESPLRGLVLGSRLISDKTWIPLELRRYCSPSSPLKWPYPLPNMDSKCTMTPLSMQLHCKTTPPS